MSGVRIERKRSELIGDNERLRPLRDHIVIHPLAWQPSKIIELAGDTRKPLRGRVVAVGPGCYPKRYNRDRSKTWDSRAFRRCEVVPGDIVELGGLEADGWDFPQVIVGTEMYVIAREEDVCGVVDG